MSRTLYVVLRNRGLAWAHNKNLREQALWDQHAAYMDDLTSRGIVVLAGPLDGTPDAMIVFDVPGGEAEIRHILERDPWSHTHHLETKSIQPWTVLLDAATFKAASHRP
jgi:hypothetical protein